MSTLASAYHSGADYAAGIGTASPHRSAGQGRNGSNSGDTQHQGRRAMTSAVPQDVYEAEREEEEEAEEQRDARRQQHLGYSQGGAGMGEYARLVAKRDSDEEAHARRLGIGSSASAAGAGAQAGSSARTSTSSSASRPSFPGQAQAAESGGGGGGGRTSTSSAFSNNVPRTSTSSRPGSSGSSAAASLADGVGPQRKVSKRKPVPTHLVEEDERTGVGADASDGKRRAPGRRGDSGNEQDAYAGLSQGLQNTHVSDESRARSRNGSGAADVQHAQQQPGRRIMARPPPVQTNLNTPYRDTGSGSSNSTFLVGTAGDEMTPTAGARFSHSSSDTFGQARSTPAQRSASQPATSWVDSFSLAPEASQAPISSYNAVVAAQDRFRELRAQQQQRPTAAPLIRANPPQVDYHAAAAENRTASPAGHSARGASTEGNPFSDGAADAGMENMQDTPYAGVGANGRGSQHSLQAETASRHGSSADGHELEAPSPIEGLPRFGGLGGSSSAAGSIRSHSMNPNHPQWENFTMGNRSLDSATSSLQTHNTLLRQQDGAASIVSTAALSRVMPAPQAPGQQQRPAGYAASPLSSERTNSASSASQPAYRAAATAEQRDPASSQDGRPVSPDRISGAGSSAANTQWGSGGGGGTGGRNSSGYEPADPWGRITEEGIDYEEICERHEQLSLSAIRRRLVVMFPQLGSRHLRSAYQPLEIVERNDEHVLGPALTSEKEARRRQEKLEAREKDLTIEATSKQEMASVTVSVYTEQREGKWSIRKPVEPDGEAIALEPPGAMDPWSVPIDAKGILERKKLKSNIELTATRMNVKCPECARATRLDLTCHSCAGHQVVEMSYVIMVTLRVANFLPLKLPAMYLAGIRQPHIRYIDVADPAHRSSVLRERAIEGTRSAATRVGKQHWQQHGSRLLLAKARVERRGVLSIAVTSSKTRVRRTFDVQDGQNGKIADTTELTSGPNTAAGRSSGSTYRGAEAASGIYGAGPANPSQENLRASGRSAYSRSNYAPSTSGVSVQSSRSAKAKAALKGMFGRSQNKA